MKSILLIMGLGFTFLGTVVGITLIAASDEWFVGLIPLVFVVVGLAMTIGVIKSMLAQRRIKTKGRHYKAKIYSYVDDTSVLVNGAYLVNCKVHYFDEFGVEKEGIIPTAFSRGSNQYPIGMTIDIYEYQGKFQFDKGSVRDEVLDREDELMDDKPLERSNIRMVAISCQSCGISYEAVSGYTASCPYCGAHINAPAVNS